ncbi:MAG: pyruvate dehydrogenase complex dihydrolipoamide acetyltransferase [Acidobacteriota bacterium]
MAQIIMPKLSDTMTEGVIVRWLKKEGDVVSMGDVVAEIETDKATMEFEAFDEGVMKAIYVKEGDKVAVGEPIALIGEEGESPATPVEKVEALPKRRIAQEPVVLPKPKASEVRRARELAGREEGYSQALPHPPEPVKTDGRIKASPLARKLAAKLGIDLAAVEGSGPGGRIIQEDVLSAAESQPSAAVSPPAATAPAPTPEAEFETIALTPMRRVIAQRMVESKSQVPHFYLTAEYDAGPLMALRAQANASLEAAGADKLSVNDFILKACVEALRRVPQVNSSFSADGIVKYLPIHLGFAVSLEEGLITPVIRNAEMKSLRQISSEARDLASRARARKLKPEEYQGGTFTISNLGPLGIDFFQAIINPPQAAILAVGSVTKKPVVDAQDRIVVGQRMSVTLSCDHRVVDGAVGARFLQELRQLIENPALMLI